MRLQEFSNASSFLDRTGPLLFEEEITNNLLLSSALALSKNGVARVPKLSFFTAFGENDRPSASVLQSPNRRLILSTADDDSARFLGAQLSKRVGSLRGVFAPVATAAKFVEAFEKGGGTPHERRLEQDLMLLEKVLKIEAAPGIFRAATAKDLPRLMKWSHAFAVECGLDEPPGETEEVVRKYLENRQLFVWDVNHKPVAMAAYGGLTPRAARISMVYTDPSQRGKGYATTLVHRLVVKLMKEGRSACVLFVDSANPVSRRVYERIGFRSIATFADYRFNGSKVTTTG